MAVLIIVLEQAGLTTCEEAPAGLKLPDSLKPPEGADGSASGAVVPPGNLTVFFCSSFMRSAEYSPAEG